MGTPMLLSSLSVVLAFSAAALVVLGGSSWLKRASGGTRFSHHSTGAFGEKVAWRLRNGYFSLLPMAEKLLKNTRVKTLTGEGVQLCAERQWVTTEQALVTVVIMGSAVLALMGGLISRSFVGALALGMGTVAVVVAVIRTASDRRCDRVREAIPDVLRSMSTCFEAGLTLQQTFAQIALETKGSLHVRFSHAAHVLEMGGGASEALAEFKQGEAPSDLAFIAVALDVQHQAGGSLKQVLDAARDAVEGEMTLRRSLKVQTAQARLSARVVSVMPFALIAVFSLISNDFLAPFFASPAGYALLAVALGMQVAGVGLVRRVLAAGVTS